MRITKPINKKRIVNKKMKDFSIENDFYKQMNKSEERLKKTLYFIVDRIENENAVCELTSKPVFIDIPLLILPDDVKEDDIIKITKNNDTMYISVDKKLTADRKSEMLNYASLWM